MKHRFLKGAIRFFGVITAVYYLQGSFDLTHLQHILSKSLESSFGKDLASLILLATYLITLYLFFYLLFSGFYYMVSWEYPLDFFESKRGKCAEVYGNGQFPNLNRILEYREARMGMMTSEQASKYLRETSKLDSLYNSTNGKNTAKTLNYIEGKIGLMSNDTAVKYLQGKL